MRLGVALDLGCFNDFLPAHALARVFGIDGPAAQRRIGEHQALGDIGIVGYGQETGAGGGAGLVQPSPQIIGIGALQGGNRLEGTRLVAVGIGDHHAMQVGAAGKGTPFPAQQGGEPTRLVVRLGSRNDFRPGGSLDLRIGGYGAAGDVPRSTRRHPRIGTEGENLAEQRRTFPRIDGIAYGAGDIPVDDAVPESRVLLLQAVVVDVAQPAEKLGVIRDDQKIQRRRQLHARPVIGMNNGLALGEPVGGIRVGGEIVVEEGIEGIGGVQVGIAPQQLPLCGCSGSDTGQRHGDGGQGRGHRSHRYISC